MRLRNDFIWTCFSVLQMGGVFVFASSLLCLPANAVQVQGAVSPRKERKCHARFIDGAGIRLRSEPNPTSPVVTILGYGTQVCYSFDQGEWSNIRVLAHPNIEGWVGRKLLTHEAPPLDSADLIAKGRAALNSKDLSTATLWAERAYDVERSASALELLRDVYQATGQTQKLQTVQAELPLAVQKEREKPHETAGSSRPTYFDKVDRLLELAPLISGTVRDVQKRFPKFKCSGAESGTCGTCDIEDFKYYQVTLGFDKSTSGVCKVGTIKLSSREENGFSGKFPGWDELTGKLGQPPTKYYVMSPNEPCYQDAVDIWKLQGDKALKLVSSEVASHFEILPQSVAESSDVLGQKVQLTHERFNDAEKSLIKHFWQMHLSSLSPANVAIGKSIKDDEDLGRDQDELKKRLGQIRKLSDSEDKACLLGYVDQQIIPMFTEESDRASYQSLGIEYDDTEKRYRHTLAAEAIKAAPSGACALLLKLVAAFKYDYNGVQREIDPNAKLPAISVPDADLQNLFKLYLAMSRSNKVPTETRSLIQDLTKVPYPEVKAWAENSLWLLDHGNLPLYQSTAACIPD